MRKNVAITCIFQLVKFLPTRQNVETIALIERIRNVKDYVQIGIDAEDYYRIKDAKQIEIEENG